MIAVHPPKKKVLGFSKDLGIQTQPYVYFGESKTIITTLADGALVVAWDQRREDCCRADEHEQTEQEVAVDRAREANLQAYLNQMAEFILEKKLRTTDREDVRNDAQFHTLTILPELDGDRKGYILRFVYVKGLINKDTPILQLSGADLSEANLCGADLSGANMSSACMCDARLDDANLGGIDLRQANLTLAHMRNSDLSGADLRQANLYLARLSNAELRRANLHQANLRSAWMHGANLSDANLDKANLERANLDLADLRGATVTSEQLAEARGLKDATMPDGTRWAAYRQVGF